MAEVSHSIFFQKISTQLGFFQTAPKTASDIVALFQSMHAYVKEHPDDTSMKSLISEFIITDLSKLSEKVFNRAILKQNPLIEEILVDATEPVVHLKEAKMRYGEKGADTQEVFLDLIEAEARFALLLGVRPKIAGDTSSAYFLRSIEGNRLAIFKPDTEGPRGKLNQKIVSKIRRIGGKFLGLTAIRQGMQHVGEEATYRIADNLGLKIVPPTRILEFSKKDLTGKGEERQSRGSLQAFIEEASSAGDVLKQRISFFSVIQEIFQKAINRLKNMLDIVSNWPEIIKKIEVCYDEKVVPPALFAQLVVIDVLTGQIDRHFDNFLFRMQKESFREDLKKTSLIAIDNGASFIKGYVVNGFEGKFQYAWTRLPIAKSSLKDLLEESMRKQILVKLQECCSKDSFKSEIIQEFLKVLIPEDFPEGVPEDVAMFIIQMAQDSRWINERCQIVQLPTRASLIKKFKKKYPLPEGVKKDLWNRYAVRAAKGILQVMSMRERASVLTLFLDPKQRYKHYFTAEKLGSLKTEDDYQLFWKEYDHAEKMHEK